MVLHVLYIGLPVLAAFLSAKTARKNVAGGQSSRAHVGAIRPGLPAMCQNACAPFSQTTM
jgi:hypothetical protein|eukprot:COSAG06_NODE_32_length_31260_cov_54.706973_4_plen_60_part_00